MKLIAVILSAALILFSLAACGAEPEAPTQAPATEPAPQLHTVTPTVSDPEPEWAPVDCELELRQGDQALLSGDDLEYFAIIGSGDNAEIVIKLSETAVGILSSQEISGELTLTVDSEEIGGAELSKDMSEVTLTGDYDYEGLCELATRIRGL